MKVARIKSQSQKMGRGECLVNHMFSSRILLRMYPASSSQSTYLSSTQLLTSETIHNRTKHKPPPPDSLFLLQPSTPPHECTHPLNPKKISQSLHPPPISNQPFLTPPALCHTKPTQTTHANASMFHQLIHQIKRSSEKGKYDGHHHQGATLGYSTTS